jgi:ubiquinone/menaquinone biosynthesis C-methylase UbiE
MPQNIYDNPEFFAGYDNLRETASGLSEALEQPAFRSLLPPQITGLRVLDLGCGAGDMCRWLAEHGAASVTGADVSERMLEKARKQVQDRVTYIRGAAEEITFPSASFDLVVSSLMLHYIQEIKPVFEKIYTWLTPGGKFVFSMEHPVGTAAQGRFERAWERDSDGRKVAWRLAHYSDEGERVSKWFVDGVIKYHRTTATMINTLIETGFRITHMLESHATEQAEQARRDLLEERMRPPFLFIAAEKNL